ncbi:TraX family protein [Geopseudomonas aromaticivorans]
MIAHPAFVRHWSRASARDGALDAVRWLAVLAMTIDHLCYVLSPRLDGIYVLMRVAVPFTFFWIAGLHALKLAPGTPARALPWRSLGLMALFAVIAQAPYRMAFGAGTDPLNILFTLLLGQVLLWGVVRRDPLMVLAPACMAFTLEVVGLRLCYGMVAIVLPAMVYLGLRSEGVRSAAWQVLTALTLAYCHMPAKQTEALLTGQGWVWLSSQAPYAFAMMALVSVWLVPHLYLRLHRWDLHLWHGPRWFFHAYYAGHLVLIAAVAALLK